MKKTLIALASMMATVGLWAQGSVNFSNYPATTSFRALWYDADGITKVGNTYQAQLYAGSTAGSLAAVGGTTTFKMSGANPTGALVSLGVLLPFPWGSTFFYQAKVWSTAYGSYDAAALVVDQHIGTTAVASMTLPVEGITPNLPSDMNLGALTMTIVPVPEPSAIALGVLGGLGLFLLRRRS